MNAVPATLDNEHEHGPAKGLLRWIVTTNHKDIGTLYLVFALGFVVMFTIGGFTGVMMALVPLDFQYHDTYFIVAHFHYTLVTGAVFALIAAVYYWLPKWTGHLYDEQLGQLHFWLSAISDNAPRLAAGSLSMGFRKGRNLVLPIIRWRGCRLRRRFKLL